LDHKLAGVYAAALTPMRADYSPDIEAVPGLLEFLEIRGCHGALLLGTTGEGPSFSFDERIAILRAGVEYKQIHPQFRLLAGTGTPSLTETIALTQAAFSLGCDGVVVLPPYYYRKVNEEGLFAWFSDVLNKSVPPEGFLLGYHIPPVTGIHFSLDLLARLKETFPIRFAGIKDSSGDANFAKELGERFGKELLVLTGNDRLLKLALDSCAGGCITALANLYSPMLRRIWDETQSSISPDQTQHQIDLLRTVLDSYSPYPPILKAILSNQQNFPLWAVRPPLLPVTSEVLDEALGEFSRISNNY
jgi:4-hydroxy-tetrahydrodipicolinate synthase